jgi:hypothetical protein
MENLRLGGLGMKLTDRPCSGCGVELTTENWYESHQLGKGWYRCKECFREYANKKLNPKRNPKRMFVNGKYVSFSHPLYKPGNYKTFEDAAFSSLSKYKKTKAGQVYIVVNKAWKGWVKIGSSIDAEDRCNGYQTSSPFRDYKLKFKKDFKNRRLAESKAHKVCKKKAEDFNSEWFKLPIKTAIEIIENIKEENYEKETA